MKKYFLNKVLFLGAILLGIGACAHGPKVQEFPDTASPSAEIMSLETDINLAFNNQVNVLSYKNFNNANDELISAKKSLDKQKSSKTILHKVAKGRAYLDLANDGAKLSHTYMEEVITARQKAINAGAERYFSKDFKKADAKLIKVTQDLEKNKLESAANNRVELQKAYLAVELQAIKEANLSQAQKTINLAKKEGAEKFAPRTLAIAEKSYKDADAFITGNRYEEKQIKNLSNEASIQAEHLLKITRSSKLGDKTTSEETALKIYNERNEFNEKQENLVEETALLIESERKKNLNTQNELINSMETAEALKVANRNLKAAQVFSASFEKARSVFPASEADVYKKGDTLVIRLKELNFSSGKATVAEPNFKLLAKVATVIKGFDNSTVTVEGHTDSIGGAEANNKLALERAQTVKEYLVTNGSVNSNNITAVGYGFQKPLASNKTSAGRTINRRVDVLIKPENPKE